MTDKDTHNIHIQTYIHITHIYKDYTYIDTHNTCTYICTQHIYTPHTYIYTQCMYTCYICIYIVNTHRHHPPVQIHIRGTQTYIHHTNTHTDIHTHSPPHMCLQLLSWLSRMKKEQSCRFSKFFPGSSICLGFSKWI